MGGSARRGRSGFRRQRPIGRRVDLAVAGLAVLDELAALDPPQRREAAKELRKVTETFAEVPDARDTAHTFRLLAPHARLRLTGADWYLSWRCLTVPNFSGHALRELGQKGYGAPGRSHLLLRLVWWPNAEGSNRQHRPASRGVGGRGTDRRLDTQRIPPAGAP